MLARMPAYWIYGFHALFYLTFLPRVLGRAGEPSPPAEAPAATARFSRSVLAVHVFAMFVLYLGLGGAAFGPLNGRRVGFLVPPLPPLGALVMLAAAALAAWTVAVFRSWRLRAQIEPGHELSTDGPFRLVRNPIYLGMDLLALGTFLWVPTPIVLVGMLLVFLGGDLRARAEEKVLAAAFGDRYRDYAARVKRFVPGLY
jgi:protein-S-isoprenylcysteine O-methyltransferase Ste14